jgi:hypothetical protein
MDDKGTTGSGEGTIPGTGRAPTRSSTAAEGRQSRPDHSHMTLDELRMFRTGLRNEENRISYLRRVVQARIDLLESTGADREGVARFGEVFDRARSGPGSLLRHTLPPGEVPEVPDMSGLWSEPVDPDDSMARDRLLELLRKAERQLSDYRAVLHHHLDVATVGLIRRYQADPTQSLSLLPDDRR